MVIILYIHIKGDEWPYMFWHMNAQRYLKSVIVLYISIHGDKYLLVGVYMDMTRDKVNKTY